MLNAFFQVNVTEIIEGQTVQFTDSTTGGSLPLTYQWNFGDGSENSTIQNPIHKYNSAGTYLVVLTVTDADGDVSVYGPIEISSIQDSNEDDTPPDDTPPDDTPPDDTPPDDTTPDDTTPDDTTPDLDIGIIILLISLIGAAGVAAIIIFLKLKRRQH